MKSLLLLLSFIAIAAEAQTLDQQKIIAENNGRVTNVRIKGSLASTKTVICIPITEAKNTYTPADLYQGVANCISQEKFDLAAGLFALAGIYGQFDAERVADKSAGQAKTVLIMSMFASVSQNQKSKFYAAFSQIAKTPELFGKLCIDIQKVGMPNYYPEYMILHGIKAFTGNSHDAVLVKDFDAPRVWVNLQTTYLHCPA